jgi:hypothetical protein
LDLFSVDPTQAVAHRLDALNRPAPERFPFNRASTSVRSVVWLDLVTSEDPLIVTCAGRSIR